jgi:3-oxoacyl-[acyl-carrier protein] reductase
MSDNTTPIVLVTGASRGIGAAISDKFVASGAMVIGTATSQAGADKISERFEAAGGTGVGWVLNVTEADACEATLKAIADEYGALSVLINNAGITRDTLTMRMKESDWDAVIDTNLTSVWRLSKLAIKPMMKQRFGRIINISSVVGHTGNAGQVNYAAAKAGLSGMTKSMAWELGSRGITVNAIAPGFIQSDMTDELSDEQKSALMGSIALGRFGSPEDVAAAAQFLASDSAGYITGHTLHVNGGMYMG